MKLVNKFKRKDKRYPWYKFYTDEAFNFKVPNISIYELLKEKNKDNLNLVALNYFNHKITFGELFDNIDICARALRSQGIRPGDVVAICMPNTPETVILVYAINKVGAIANMIHPLSAEEEIKNSLISTNSVMLFMANICYDAVKNIINETSVYKTTIISPGDSMPKGLKVGYYITKGRKIKTPKKSEEYLYWNDFLNKGRKYTEHVLEKTSKDQPAFILHSGGTTGTPKNIILTNGNVNSVAIQAISFLPDLNSDDIMLAVLPMFHCFGLVVCVHVPLCKSASVVLVPQFDAKRFDKLLTKYRPTLLAGVPTLFEAILNNKYLEKADLSYLKYVVSGGDSLNPIKNKAVNDFLAEHNCNKHIIQGYGMTETTGPATFGALGSDVLGSVGIPLPGNKIKIVEPNTKKELGFNETGEIYISGPTVMAGYLNNAKETNDILEQDERGNIWVKTGDLGYLNEDGVLFFAQRLKRMLIVSGYNVYPSHIEEVLMKHPAVLNCGVIGIPHPYKVQVPKAYIVLDEKYKLNSKIKSEIKEYCEKNLAVYMRPKEYVFRESLPKTLVGKVNYRELEKEEKQ